MAEPKAQFELKISQDQWHSIADGLETPWPRAAAQIDRELWEALGAPLRPHQCVLRWGWTMRQVREFFRPGNPSAFNDGENRE